MAGHATGVGGPQRFRLFRPGVRGLRLLHRCSSRDLHYEKASWALGVVHNTRLVPIHNLPLRQARLDEPRDCCPLRAVQVRQGNEQGESH